MNGRCSVSPGRGHVEGAGVAIPRFCSQQFKPCAGTGDARTWTLSKWRNIRIAVMPHSKFVARDHEVMSSEGGHRGLQMFCCRVRRLRQYDRFTRPVPPSAVRDLNEAAPAAYSASINRIKQQNGREAANNRRDTASVVRSEKEVEQDPVSASRGGDAPGGAAVFVETSTTSGRSRASDGVSSAAGYRQRRMVVVRLFPPAVVSAVAWTFGEDPVVRSTPGHDTDVEAVIW